MVADHVLEERSVEVVVLLPLVFLLQLAVIVALGVLMDTLLVRALLVPAIIHDLGRTFWWPSALSRSPEHADVTENVG